MNIIQTIKQAITPTTQQPSVDTTTHILTKQRFCEFRDAFKTKARNKQVTALDILLYNIIRGLDQERGFTPITNPRKLCGGENVYNGQRKFFNALNDLRWYTGKYVTGEHKTNTFLEYYKLTPYECELINKEL